jgi:hypothetical protein
MWLSIAIALASVLTVEFIAPVLLTPGWANGWPFGLSFQAVLAAGAAIWFGVCAMTATAGAGALLESVAALVGLSARRGWRLYILLLCLSAAVIICASPWVYDRFCDLFWMEFPDGYRVD